MAPLEMIWPEEMHTPPTAIAYAVKGLYRGHILTSDIGLLSWLWRCKDGGKPIETLDDLSDAAHHFGLTASIGFRAASPNTGAQKGEKL